MTNSKNETAMRAAGKAYLTAGSSVVAILRAVTADLDWTDEDKWKEREAYINTLKFEFYLGGMLTVEPDEAKARAYIPDDNVKTIKKCAYSPFPSDKPDSFDATKHRTQEAQRVFNQMKANWSNWREAAGLPSLKVTKAAQAPSGDKDEDKTADAPKVTPKGLGVETGLSKKIVIEYIRGVEDWLTRTFNANRDQVNNGRVGDVLRKLIPDLNAYLVDLTEALQRDTDAAPLPSVVSQLEAAETAKTLAETRAALVAMKAEMTAMRDREAGRAAEIETAKAKKAATKAAKAA